MTLILYFFQPDDDIVYFNDRYVNGELSVMFAELNVKISKENIVKACKSLNNGKSSGPDNILNECLKYGIENEQFLAVLYTILHDCVLFNKLFDIGYFPESWSEGLIVPLHKKGELDDVSNYRDITLLSTLGKLFSKIINDRLNRWAESRF